MTTLVVGASGATGRRLVDQLLARGEPVRAILRSSEGLPDHWHNNNQLELVIGSISELSDAELLEHSSGCKAIASCLGHSMSFAGIYGKPRRLVTDAVHRLCATATTQQPAQPLKFVLMNATGNRNRDLNEPISFAQHCVIGLIRLLVPPHADNEQAADYLSRRVDQANASLEWVVVRPDSLVDADAVSDYDLHPSPTRSAIFDAGKTSRINVADFMAGLIVDENLWAQWRGQMPVIYNRE